MAARAWFAAAETTDRAARVIDDRLVNDRRAVVEVRAAGAFDLRRSLELSVRVLPQGSSFLLVTDGLDLAASDAFDDVLLRIARRFDATVLIAHDPWLEGLPLRGLVRMRDAETGRARAHLRWAADAPPLPRCQRDTCGRDRSAFLPCALAHRRPR